MVSAPAAQSSVAAAHERMKMGRNEPCPCGSDRKYKKCCLRTDEDLVRQAANADSDTVARAREIDARKVAQIAETDRRRDELWQSFDGLDASSTEQTDEWVEKMLALPAYESEWDEVLHTCAEKRPVDLPAVFRRIAAVVPHTPETGMCYFYWAAADECTRRGFGALLPEVVAGFERLGADNYDAEALMRIEDILLGGRYETEALELAERFLHITREDESIFHHAKCEQYNLIFQMRAGIALRSEQVGASSSPALTEILMRDLEGDIQEDGRSTYGVEQS